MIRLDRELGLRTALMTLLLLWPLMLFGQPTYFADSLSYYKGGKVAVAYVEAKVSPGPAILTRGSLSTTSSYGPDAGAAAIEDAKGARSIVYSVAAYLLRWPGADMVLLAVAQAMATALIIATMTAVADMSRGRDFVLIAVIVAGMTPAACFANLIIPDILAGVLIAILAMIAAAGERISRALRMILVTIASFAVTAHASHPPLAAGMCMLGTLWLWFGRAGRRGLIAWLFAPLVLGTVATVATGFIGFGTVSLAAKRYPLTLARSIEDGPARWYLKQHCATRHYAVCEVFGNEMPATVPEFLWGGNGLTGRATPVQMDRIRAEEQEIVLAAAEAYPSAQASKTAGNVALQLVSVGLTETRFDMRVARDAMGVPYLVPTRSNHDNTLAILEWLTICSVVGSAAWLAWRFRQLGKDDRAMVLLVAAGLVGNAIICAVFSGVADRYQARVIWLIPLLALALALRRPATIQPER